MGADRRTHRGRLGVAPDRELVALAAAGDAGAFAELVGRHQRVVFSVARSCGLGAEDAADVTQVAFAALVLGSLAFERPSAPYDVILMGLVTVFTLVSVSLYLVEWVRHMSTIEAPR